ncbi:hypothetical protein BDV93DRAFT_521415 [Ceratobasidium sp. AG-I]|nr:hypothetical protein BDV93DRAFT_521415 [Ceratobasidium sp. AG-I]
MAHLHHIKPEAAPDYRVLFEIDRTWTCKEFALAIRGALRGPLGLVRSVCGFARFVWSGVLDVFVGFLYAIAWQACVLGKGMLCVFWLLWKGVLYPAAYLVLVLVYHIVWGVSVVLRCATGRTCNNLVVTMVDEVPSETPGLLACVPGEIHSQSAPVTRDPTPSPRSFKECPRAARNSSSIRTPTLTSDHISETTPCATHQLQHRLEPRCPSSCEISEAHETPSSAIVSWAAGVHQSEIGLLTPPATPFAKKRVMRSRGMVLVYSSQDEDVSVL